MSHLLGRASASVLIFAGIVLGLVSVVIFSFGVVGLLKGMHGGPVSAILVVAVGLIPGAYAYIFIRKGIRMFRHAGQSSP